MKEISIEIDSLGRVKKKGKGLGQQYENNVTKYAITLDSSLVNPTYFYYIIVVPPTSTGKKMYAVPMLTENFEYVISSAITQYVGTWKFCMLIMHKELSGVDTIPVEGVVKITDEWEDEVEKGIIDNVQLEEQIADINLKIAYEELLLVKQEVESAADYAELQGAYAKNVADQLLEDKESGAFTGNPGPKGNDGVSPTAKVEQKVGGALLVVNDANGTTTAELKDGQTPYIGPNGNWWVGNQDTGTRPDSDYVLSPAGKNYLGGVIVGDNLDVTEDGRVSVVNTAKFDDGVILSGTEIETDSLIAIESNLHISGNSEQDSRSGKNIFNENNIKGVTYSGDDLIFTNNGTLVVEKIFKESTQYTFQAELKQGISGSYARLRVYYTDGTDYDAMLNSSTEYAYKSYTSLVNKTIEKVITYGANMLNIKKGTFQIEEGTVATDYEPYGIQPSPEFESPIMSVKSKSDNLFDSDYSLVTKGGFVKQSDGSYYLSAVKVVSGVWVNTENYAGQIAISCEMKWTNYGESSGEILQIEYTDGTKTSTKSQANTAYQDKWGYTEFISDKTKTVKQINLTYGGSSQNYFRNVMLNKGTVALPYQPYGYVPVEVKVEGKNLVYLENKETSTNYEALKCSIKEQSITLNGDCAGGNILPILRDENNEEVLINLEANQKYYFKMFVESGTTTGTGDDIQLRNGNKTVFTRNTSQWISGFSYTPTTNISATWMRIYLGARTFDNYKFKLLISKENSAKWLEPKPLKLISFPLNDIQLRSTPDGTRDTFERANGAWNKVSNIGSVVLSGNETNWGYNSTYKVFWISAGNIGIYGYSRGYFSKICNRFKYHEKSGNELGLEDGLYENSNRTAPSQLLFHYSEIETLDEWKTWLSNNPIEIVYPLATPTYTPITDQALITALDEIEQLILHKGYNYITATSVNGVKAYIDLEIPPSALVTNVVETESPQELIIPAVSGAGDVKVKISISEENQPKLNPNTGLVKVKSLEVNGKNVESEIDKKAGTSTVLTKTNTTSYTPSANYHPATKKYVDDSIASAITNALGGSY